MGPTSMHESALSKTIGTLGSGSGSGSVKWDGELFLGDPWINLPLHNLDKYVEFKVEAEERKEVCRKIASIYARLRTWILKEEVNDLSIIMEDHKKLGNNMDVQLCQMVGQMEKVVEEIGEENVVQVITDNASNYVNAGMRLMEKRSRLWWTPCAAHCIDLMLEDIGKLNVHATTLSRARQVVKFIYGHTWTTVPLVSVLREVDSEERPAMAGYYLNPQLRYGDKFSNVDEVRKGLFECMDRMLDYQERLKADIQLDSYDQAMGEFGSRIAIDSRTLRSPTSWWMRFGGSTPELQKFAIRVLSLTCSASGYPYKKRNRLEHQRLNALVYVRYNTRLRERSLQRKQNVDPILVEEIDSDDEWIAEKEDPLLPLDLCWLQDNELFNVDAIRVVSSNSQETQASSDHMVSSHSYKRKHNEVPSTSGGKGKEKELNLTPIDEDEDLDEMGIHDSRHFPTIDTLDEDDDDLGEEDLS
ncbi:hypothetical protein CK203_092696 [Vitis vinifera]|uniref:DUF659 domain-containing protein n=1 Tax=Vitis vinifera TaxID=29760 RepID=A0A438ENV4_VITVI|nr:hypothetical protein CK203_092696 [Vitis vinifera]